MEEKKSKKRKSEYLIEEKKFTPDTIVVDDQHENNPENPENNPIKYDNQDENYDELIQFLRNENVELVDIITDKTKSKQHPYKFILDTFQLAEHQQRIIDNPDFISHYDTQLIEVTTKEELDIVIENISNLKEIGIHCGNCTNFYHIKVGVLILRTVDKCYLIDLTKLRNSVTLLTQVFINPNIVKILYDCDEIMKHLQQDLSLYFVNIFDINIARRILQMDELPIREFLEQNYETYGKIPRDPMIYVKRPLPDFVKNYCKYLVNYHIHAYRNLKNQLLVEDQNLYYQILDQCNNKCKIVYQQSDKMDFLKIANEIKIYQSYQWRLLAKLYKLREELAKVHDKNPKQIIHPRSLINIILQNPGDKIELNQLSDSSYVSDNIEQIFGIIEQLRVEMNLRTPPIRRTIRDNSGGYRSNFKSHNPIYKRNHLPITATTTSTTTTTDRDPLLLNSVNESLKRVADGLSTLMAGTNPVQEPSTSHHHHQEIEEEYNNETTWQIDRQGDGYYNGNQESYQYHHHNKRNRNSNNNNNNNANNNKKLKKNKKNNRQDRSTNQPNNEKRRKKGR